ncbi:YshB family small membrane protein [Escherichia coli]|nr:YshB family small membrane protein [Escherichia coli]
MLESIINLVSSGAVDSHTPQTAVAAVAAVAAVLCAAMIGLFS